MVSRHVQCASCADEVVLLRSNQNKNLDSQVFTEIKGFRDSDTKEFLCLRCVPTPVKCYECRDFVDTYADGFVEFWTLHFVCPSCLRMSFSPAAEEFGLTSYCDPVTKGTPDYVLGTAARHRYIKRKRRKELKRAKNRPTISNEVLDQLHLFDLEVEEKLVRQIEVEGFKVFRFLGDGSYGKVFAVECLANRHVYACKCIDTKKGGTREVKFLKLLRQENIVTYYSDFEIKIHVEQEDPDLSEKPPHEMIFLIVIMELAIGPYGDLVTVMRKKPFLLTPKFVSDLGFQIASAFLYSHENFVIHRDIKPDNLLLSVVDGRLRVKVTDFGIGVLANPNRTRHTIVGTSGYMAPEIARGHHYDFSADIYSLGQVLHNIVEVAERTGISHDKLLQDLCKSMRHEIPEKRVPISEVYDFFLQCRSSSFKFTDVVLKQDAARYIQSLKKHCNVVLIPSKSEESFEEDLESYSHKGVTFVSFQVTTNLTMSEKPTLVALTKISENREVLNFCPVDHFRIGDSVELRNLFSGDEDWLKADVVDIGSDSFLHAVHFSLKYGDMLVLDSNYLGDIVRGTSPDVSSVNFQLVHQIMEAKKNEALEPRKWGRTFGGGLKLMTAAEIWELEQVYCAKRKQGMGILACCCRDTTDSSKSDCALM